MAAILLKSQYAGLILGFRPVESLLYPLLNEVEGGYTGFTLSVCLSVCLLSVDRIMSALYLQQYSSDPFQIYTSYQATSENVLHVKFLSKLKNLKFRQIL